MIPRAGDKTSHNDLVLREEMMVDGLAIWNSWVVGLSMKDGDFNACEKCHNCKNWSRTRTWK
jgi:hypothetical protein